MDNYIIQMLDEYKDNEHGFIIELSQVLFDKTNYGEHLDRLDEIELTFYLINELEMEVNNGGLDQYFFNSSGKNAKKAIAALHKIEATFTANLVQEAQKCYDGGWKGPLLRFFHLYNEDKQLAEMDKFDKVFYEYRESISELLINYIRKNLKEVVC
ncbi:DUF4375 domain-containing protein [Paenibacillus sp. PR3]|uniref:DUF4375 domain-containing protein n=1 Tax=Paenibacillus terricola TaxID=2763503 RepID=A0ABR8N6P0_9BACL|nr:DUF4375 domain-containing protein [Paenibacillus terricola]MBD3922144.1 DUF4375 domain-containing protein [Paenibacillus terricola]